MQRNNLIPKQMEENGIEKGKLTIQSAALKKIINNYTKEAGVRNLERTIGQICRKTARLIMEEDKKESYSDFKRICQIFLEKSISTILWQIRKMRLVFPAGLPGHRWAAIHCRLKSM